MIKKLLLIVSLLAVAGCGGQNLNDIEPLEVETEDTYMDINQEDFEIGSDSISPSVNGPSTPPSVKGPTTPPPNS